MKRVRTPVKFVTLTYVQIQLGKVEIHLFSPAMDKYQERLGFTVLNVNRSRRKTIQNSKAPIIDIRAELAHQPWLVTSLGVGQL